MSFWLNGFSFEARFSIEGEELLLVEVSMGGGDEGFRGGYFVLGVVSCNL